MDRQTICRAVALMLAAGASFAAEAQLSGPGAMTNTGPFGAPIGSPPAKKADPQLEAAEKAFLALDIAERKAIQLDLIWGAKFPGSPTGDFGPLTFSAIKRFQAEARAPQSGVLSAPERTRLAQVADQRRKAAEFAVLADKVSGMRIGLPGFMAVRSAPNSSGGTRYQDKDERVTVDLMVYKPEDTLPDLFERGIDAKVRGRKITYKLLRPEFFVITGETAGGKFYRRLEMENGAVRGFSIGYDKMLAGTVDPFVVAIAATFEAFPKAGGKPPSAAPRAAPLIAAAPARRRSTGLALSPTLVATGEEALKGCRDIAIATGADSFLPARVTGRLGDTGLVMLEARAPAPLALRAGDPTDGPATLVQRDSEGALLASAATIAGGKVETSLQDGGAGAAIFDRAGAFVGVIAASPVTKFRVAGIVPTLAYPLIPARRVLEGAGVAAGGGGDAAAKTAAAIAEANRAGVVSLVCRSDP